MSAEQSWGADAVAFGRPGESEESDPAPRRRPPRGPQRQPSLPAPRILAVAGLVIIALVALVAVLGGGSDSPKEPIRAVADPAPRVIVKPPRPPRRHELRSHRKPAPKRQPKGKLEAGKREPQKASAQPHEQAAPVAEAEPEAAAIEVVEPEPPEPTPPAVEFGM